MEIKDIYTETGVDDQISDRCLQKRREKKKNFSFVLLSRIEIEAKNRFFIFSSLSLSFYENESIVSTHPFLPYSVILFYLTIYIFSRTLPHIRRRSEPRDRNADLEGSLRSFRRNLVSPLNLAH